MAVAGKAAITMEGAWSSTKDYDRLCGVVHNNSLFISRKKPPIGVAPAENDYWMLCIEGVNEQDLDDLAVRVTNIEAKYFPKAGGTLLGDMTIQKADNGQSKIFKNHSASADYGTEIADIAKDGRKSRVVLNASSGLPPQWYDKDGNGGSFYGVFNKPTANDVGALPISGGTLKGVVNNLWAGEQGAIGRSGIAMNLNGGNEAYLCFNDIARKFEWYDAPNDHARYDILDTKNKPFGSYTGNGNTAQREIAINGIGRAILIYKSGSSTFSLITPQGGIMKKTSGLEVVNAVFYINDKLTMSTNNDMFNTSGATYYYQVI